MRPPAVATPKRVTHERCLSDAAAHVLVGCTTGPALRNTSFDTAELYSIVGYLEAADGTLTFFYNASPWSRIVILSRFACCPSR